MENGMHTPTIKQEKWKYQILKPEPIPSRMIKLACQGNKYRCIDPGKQRFEKRVATNDPEHVKTTQCIDGDNPPMW
jgi:hypothetical protein